MHRLLQVVDNGACELIGGGVAAEILSSNLAGLQNKVNGIVNLLAVVKQVDVTQHLRCAQEHGTWIGDVLADTFSESVTRSLIRKTSIINFATLEDFRHSPVRKRHAQPSKMLH